MSGESRVRVRMPTANPEYDQLLRHRDSLFDYLATNPAGCASLVMFFGALNAPLVVSTL